MGVRTTLSVAAFICATLCSAATPHRPASAVDPAVRRSHPPSNRPWSPPLAPPPLIQAPSSVTGPEDTPIPLGITVDQSLIDGGSLPDIIGTATGHRSSAAGATPNTFTIPAGTTFIRVTAYGGNNNGTPSAQSEEWQQVTSTIDLVSNTYSGYLFYALNIGTAYTASYSFSGRPLGTASNAGTIVGYNGTSSAFTASVSGNTLSLAQNQTVTDQAYLVEFLSATQRSLTPLGTQGAIQNPTGAGAATTVFTLDPNANLVVLNIQDGRGTSNPNDEERGMSRIVVDLDQARAAGNVFQIIASGGANTVSYGFTDYNITSGIPVLTSGATLTGDVTGSANVLQNFTITRSGLQLSVTRPTGVAAIFTGLLSLEQYRRMPAGSATVFTGTSSVSSVFSAFTGAMDTVSFPIPPDSQFGVLTLGMTSNQNATGDGENAGSAQIFIDLVEQTTSGSFAVMRLSTPDLVVWSNAPFGTMTFAAPGTLSNHGTLSAFSDEYPAVLKFDLITNASGSRSLRMTARPTTDNNSTPPYQNFRFTAQTAWAGRPLIEVRGVPAGGTLSAGDLNPITNVWTVDPTDLASLTFLPAPHYSGQGVALLVSYGDLDLNISVNVVRVADAPALTTADRSGPEDTSLPLTGALVPMLVDADGSEIIDRIRISGLPVGHTLSDGTHTFTASAGAQTVDLVGWSLATLSHLPPAEFNGTFPLDVRVRTTDTDGFSSTPDTAFSTGQFLVTITAVNDAPVAGDDGFTLLEDGTLTAQSVIANDSDIDNTNAQLTWSLVNGGTAGANGTLVFDPNGSFNYAPNANFNGIVSFTYRVCDAGPLCDNSNTVTITVSPVNDAPVAGDDAFNMNEDAVLTAQSVAGNDSDPDNTNAQLIWSLVSGGTAAANGTLVFNANGTFNYTPNANYNGTVSFTYRVCDPSPPCDNSNMVAITIAAVNDAPVADDDSFNVNEDAVLNTQSVTGNDGDIDNTNAQLTWSLVNGGSAAANGTLVFNANGTFNYTPNNNFNGTVSFTYRVCDAGPLCDNSNTVTITVNAVNDAPVAGDDSFNVNEDALLTAQSVTGNDSDSDNTNGQLTWSLLNGGSATINGTLTFSPNGTFNFTPNNNFNGTVSFTYRVCDAGPLCDNSNTVIITVNPMNDAPVAGDDSFNVNEDAVLNTQSVTGNDGDIDNTNAQLTWSLVNGGSAAASGTLLFNANGTFNYTPNANYNGTVSFTYRVCDPATLCDNSNTVTIAVIPVNDAPVAGDDSFGVNEDAALTAQSVAGNDNDIDNTNAQLTWSLVSGGSAAANGTLLFNANGTFNYTPNANYNGTASFTYRVCDPATLCDGTNTVALIVAAVNDAPVVLDDQDNTLPGVPVTHNVLANDNDALDGSTLDPTSVTIIAGPAHGDATILTNGTISYEPAPGFVGNDTITYRACDLGIPLPARCGTALLVIVVTDAYPHAASDAFSGLEDVPLMMDVLANDGTTNGVLVPGSVTVTTPPAHGTTSVNGNGEVDYLPDPHYNGTDGFTYAVCNDLGYCSTTTVGITLAAVNDAPVALDDTALTNEDTDITVDVQENDNDPYDAPAGGIDANSTNIVTSPLHGTAEVWPDGRIHYTPDADFHGADSLRYTLCDLGVPLPAQCASATLLVQVMPVNDVPVITDDQGDAIDTLITSTPEDTPITICLPHFDVDGDGVGLSIIGAGPMHGAIGTIAPGDTCFTYIPGPGYNGTDIIGVALCDANGACDTLLLMVDILPVNDPPVVVDAFDQPVSIVNTGTSEDQSVVICLKAIDPENDAVQLTGASSGPLHGTLSGLSDSDTCFTYMPAADFHGTDTVTVVVCDIHGACDTVQVTITVAPVNDIPMITGMDGLSIDTLHAEIVSGTAQPFCIQGTDVDGDALLRELALAPQHGEVTGLSDTQNCFTYTADPDLIGNDTLIVSVCDPQGACDQVVVIITLTNQPPQLVNDAASTAMDTDIDIAVLDNDSDPEGAPLSVESATALHGTVTIGTNGIITYSPDEGYCGMDSITYTACDPVPQCAQAIVTVEVQCPAEDLPPVLVNDHASTTSDATVDIDVLANDHDPEGDPLTITSAAAGNGAVIIGTDGTLAYTPAPGFCGMDTIRYVACDATPLCNEALVLIAVDCTTTTELRIPEGLTPNGDGHNDVWRITGLERYPNARVTVFDRWGMEVFGAAPYRNDWDGRSTNAFGTGGLPSGTYWYILDLNTGDGTTRTGYIHIIH